jgi:hypothetical protein
MKKRVLRHQKLLEKVGVDYSSFVEVEIATIINTRLRSNKHYERLIDKLDNPKDFLLKSIKNSNISYDDYDLLIKEIITKKANLKEAAVKKTELDIENLKKKISDLKI